MILSKATCRAEMRSWENRNEVSHSTYLVILLLVHVEIKGGQCREEKTYQMRTYDVRYQFRHSDRDSPRMTSILIPLRSPE